MRPTAAAADAGHDRLGGPYDAGVLWEVEGLEGDRELWLWANRCIAHGATDKDQRDALEELKRRLRLLSAASGEILEASYAGPLRAGADVENVVLYNIGSGFLNATARGVRFEVATCPRRSPPSRREYCCSYCYRIVDAMTPPTHWRPLQRLACFSAADLGAFRAGKRLEQVWLAIHRTEVNVMDAGQSRTPVPFAVILRLEVPQGRSVTASPDLVKAVVDGTVAAFQAHSSRHDLDLLARRVAIALGEEPNQIRYLLAEQRHAVLGATDHLLVPHGKGVQWHPVDHLCVAGQVILDRSTGDRWSLSGEVLAVEPRGDC